MKIRFASSGTRRPQARIVGWFAASLVAVVWAQNAFGVKTNDVELGYESVYDDLVHIRRNSAGDMTFQDSQVTSPVALSVLTEKGASAHADLSGLSADDHTQYLTATRHLSTHSGEFNSELTIPADPKGNVRLGDHVADSDIHLDRTQTVEIPGDWRFTGSPAVWDGLYFSAEGAAGDAAIHFASATAGARILWDESEARFSLNRELAVEDGPSLPPRLRVGSALSEWIASGSVLRIDPVPSGSGNLRLGYDAGDKVGIGTDAPAKALHVQSSDHADVRIEAGTNKQASLGLKNDAREWLWRCDGVDGDKMTLVDATAGSDRLVVDSSGHVGIGTDSPGSLLDVVGYETSDFYVRVYSDDNEDRSEICGYHSRGTQSSPDSVEEGDSILRLAAWARGESQDRMAACIDFTAEGDGEDEIASRISFLTSDGVSAPSEKMRISGQGKIGIGTIDPDSLLEVEGPSSGGIPLLTLDQNDASASFIDFQGTSGAGYSISTVEKSAFYRMVMIEINGFQCWIKAYYP
ncbi:hypothetical protein JW916_10560 [Candidatus Sumerlaeota bacterium]|nr:hypothetical protein [Candidatus Sumerlaeota bacterium]